jgi:hypothetical protein
MIDLKALAHDLRWRVTLDPSDAQSPRSERPWMYRVDGKRGHVFVQGEKQLAAWCGTVFARRELLAVPGARLIRDGDKEAVITFPTAQFDTVCAILKGRRRRQLTPEQRARLAKASAKGLATIHGRRSSEGRMAPISVPDAPGGLLHPPDATGA